MRIMLPLTLSIALLATMCAASLFAWVSIAPGTELAVHFTLNGTPNSYAPAPFALSIVPIAALVTTLVFAVAPRFDRKVETSPALFTMLWLFVIATLAAGHGLIVGYALATS